LVHKVVQESQNEARFFGEILDFFLSGWKGINLDVSIIFDSFTEKFQGSASSGLVAFQAVFFFHGWVKKINTLISTLHPDLQNDYLLDLEKIIN
jgi:hypothetical protein